MKLKSWKQIAQTGVVLAGFCLALLLLPACRSVSSTVRVNGEIQPEPIVGQIATLRIEAVSQKYSGDGLISIIPFNNINIIEGELEWHGPVTAGEPFIYELSFCITQPGNTGFYMAAAVVEKDTGVNQLHIVSTADSAQVIPSSEYKGELQPPQGSTPTPTPEPVLVSSECKGDIQ